MPSVSMLPTTATGSPSTTPTYEPTSSPTDLPPCGFHCPPGASGFLPLPDCVGFYACENGEMSHRTVCNNGLVFDEINQVCNWDWAVQGCSCLSELGQSSQSISVYPPVYLPPDQCNGEMRMSVNMGYYESWAKNRFGCNPIQPGEIDVAAFGYTREFYCLLSGQISISNSELVFRSAYKDLAFSFAGISWEGKLEPYNGDKSYINQYMSFNALKTSNRGLKTLIAVGGW